MRGALGQADLVAHGLAYVARVSPLSTLSIAWQASGGLISSAYFLAVGRRSFLAKASSSTNIGMSASPLPA